MNLIIHFFVEILIVYDNNGGILNLGDYKYDSEEVLAYNSSISITPRRDYEHIYSVDT